jgi:hypothetical protein
MRNDDRAQQDQLRDQSADQLRDQLRATDPARTLPPASPTWLAHRMEHIMTDQPRTNTNANATASSPKKPRPTFRRWVPVIGIAAGVAIAAAVVTPLILGGPQPTVEALQPSSGGDLASSSCLMLEPATVAAQEQAFAATVLQIEDGTVVLEVTERFAGEVADRVEVPQVDTVASDNSGVPYKVGQRYLIGAVDGMITGCGVSGTDSAELRAVYDAAFPGGAVD